MAPSWPVLAINRNKATTVEGGWLACVMWRMSASCLLNFVSIGDRKRLYASTGRVFSGGRQTTRHLNLHGRATRLRRRRRSICCYTNRKSSEDKFAIATLAISTLL